MARRRSDSEDARDETSIARSHRPGVYLRVLLSGGVMVGPGKADLLEAIATWGSISAAGRRLGMSYRRAWLLVDELNGCFRDPLVAAVPGGRGGGGARLTEAGREVLARYRAMQERADRLLAVDLADLDALIAPARRGATAPVGDD